MAVTRDTDAKQRIWQFAIAAGRDLSEEMAAELGCAGKQKTLNSTILKI
jgi:hypothetical protein